MKGIIVGFEPVDYVSKKTGEPVKGATIYMNCKSGEVFGSVCKNEFVSESSAIYKRAIAPLLEKFYDESSGIYGAAIEIDYDVTKRGNNTFTTITDIQITLPTEPKQDKKAV